MPLAVGAQGLILHADARNGYDNDQEARQRYRATVIWEMSVQAGAARAADAEFRAASPRKVHQRLDLPAVRAYLAVKIRFLTDADEELGLVSDDFPVQRANAVPAIIQAGGILDGVAHQIDDVDSIAAMVGFLNQQVDPQLVVRDAPTVQRSTNRAGDHLPHGYDLTAQDDVTAAAHGVDVVLRGCVAERNADAQAPKQVRRLSVAPCN